MCLISALYAREWHRYSMNMSVVHRMSRSIKHSPNIIWALLQIANGSMGTKWCYCHIILSFNSKINFIKSLNNSCSSFFYHSLSSCTINFMLCDYFEQTYNDDSNCDGIYINGLFSVTNGCQ